LLGCVSILESVLKWPSQRTTRTTTKITRLTETVLRSLRPTVTLL